MHQRRIWDESFRYYLSKYLFCLHINFRMIVKYFVRSDILPEVLDGLERPVEGGVEPGALVLGPGLPVVAAQQLQVESPRSVDLLLDIWTDFI